jgi:hypothetical protein
MFHECANPDCKVPFDYRAGRLIPVRNTSRSGEPVSGHHGVKHLWLCASCSEAYRFEWEWGAGDKVNLRAEELQESPDLSLAEVG